DRLHVRLAPAGSQPEIPRAADDAKASPAGERAMHPWFVTYTTGPLDVRKTFEVDADTKADAIVLGDTLAAAWLRLHGLVPGDLRGDPADGSESAAARLSYCQPAPPAWVGIFGRRADDGHHTRVTTAPMVSAILDHHGA